MTDSNTATVETVNTIKRGRGRPVVYSGAIAATIAALTAEVGAMETRGILTSRNGVVGLTKAERERAARRAALGFAKPVKGLSLPTILRIAKNAGVTLRRGRRVKVEAVANVDGFDGNAANLPTEIK